jgi:hypothetical protein
VGRHGPIVVEREPSRVAFPAVPRLGAAEPERRRVGGGKLDGADNGDDGRMLVVKNALSATLACVLALTTWGVSGGHVRKGTSWFDGFTFSRRRLNGTRAPAGGGTV